jgi:transcriptional regulator GlxA family with amidase domain
MHRRELLSRSAALGLLAALPFPLGAFSRAGWRGRRSAGLGPDLPARALPRPADGGPIRTAFLVSSDTVVIDVAGPWEVFTNVMPGGRMDVATFRPYIVAETTKPIVATGGLKVVPDYTLETAPKPHVVVIPAQSGATPAMLDWIRQSARTADLTMSVCTGAFVLAKTGLLNGRVATTHHDAYDELAKRYPDVRVVRGVRFVEDGPFASSGGLSCGIDLALRVVERYYDRKVAADVAANMEYRDQGWLHPEAA